MWRAHPSLGAALAQNLAAAKPHTGRSALLGGGGFHGQSQVEPNRGRVRGVECPHVGAGQVTRNPGAGTLRAETPWPGYHLPPDLPVELQRIWVPWRDGKRPQLD